MSAIKTAILGYGRSGSTLHADAIEGRPEFELTAVCDTDDKARDKAVERFGCRPYTDYKKMLEQDLDLVVIVTRSDQHSDMACDCLRAGKNVLVTKPWALDASNAEKMIAASKESGKLLLPWLPARWGGDLLRLRELVASGVIGNVFQVRRSEFTFGVRNDWQTQKKHGGGYLLNWGPHLVDQPLQLVGKDVKTVYAQMRQVINPGDVEDVFYAVIKTVDGVIVVSEFNIGVAGLPSWVVQGDRGTITVKDREIVIHKAVFEDGADKSAYRSKVRIETVRDEAGRITAANQYGDALIIYAHIAEALRGEKPYAIPTESALGLTRVLDAIRASSAADQTVCLARGDAP